MKFLRAFERPRQGNAANRHKIAVIPSLMWRPVVGLPSSSVRDALRKLHDGDAKVFGVDSHHFLLNPTIEEEEIEAFERRHKILLPTDYRNFLIHIGNGGAGPYYGIFPLGEMDGVDGQL